MRSILALFLFAGLSLAQAPPAGADLRRAEELYRAGNCPEAVQRLSAAAASRRAALLRARCYLEMRDFAKARATLVQLHAAAPADEESAILLARAYIKEGNPAPAAAVMEKAVSQSPQSLAARDVLAEVYGSAGKRAQAAALYKEVLQTDPADLGALVGLGDLSARDSQWAAAAEHYRLALAAAPENLAALSGMGLAQMQLGRVAEAIPYLQRALRLQPDDWDLTKTLASCYLKTGKWAELIPALEFNSLDHGDDEKITAWMVQAFTHTADASRAEQYYRSLLQRSPRNFTARVTLGNLLYDARRLKDAQPEYVLVLKARPDSPEIADRLGQIAEQGGQFAEARDYYAAACRSPRATPAMLLRLAHAYVKTDKMDSARSTYELVLKAQPGNREAKMFMAEDAMKTQHWDDVARYAGELLPGDKSNPALLRMLGEAALKSNREAEGADFLEQALAVQHNDRELRFRLARLYNNSETLNKPDRAFDLMNEYAAANPEDAEADLMLAHLYRRKSDNENARTYFQRGFQKVPAQAPAGLAWAYDSYGIMLLEEKKYEEALTFESKAVELDPKDDVAQYNMALIYLKLKRKDDVNAAREKLSQMGSALLSRLDDQIAQSHINDEPKKRK